MFIQLSRENLKDLGTLSKLGSVRFPNASIEAKLSPILRELTQNKRVTGIGVPWQFSWLGKLSRLFLVTPPKSPGYYYAGGVLDVRASGDMNQTFSVTGLGYTVSEAFSAIAGELAEMEGTFDPAEHVIASRVEGMNVDESCPKIMSLIERISRLAPQKYSWSLAKTVDRCHQVLVPSALCFVDPVNAREIGLRTAISEGCGAGKSFDDALAHGILELVERDAFCLWWHGGRPARRIVFDSDGQAAYRSFRKKVGRRSSECRDLLLDISTDLPFPVVAAVTWDENGRNLACGTAARTSYSAAISAAFREMCQLEFGYFLVAQKLSQVGISGLNQSDHAKLQQGENLKLDTLPQIGSSQNTAPISFSATSRLSESVYDGVRVMMTRGVELFYLDLGRPGGTLKTAKVISPQLQPGTMMVRTRRFRRQLELTGLDAGPISNHTLV